MTARRTRDGGFALIESIAVLALSALVLVTLLIAADLVIRNSGAAVRRAHEIEALATGFAALRRDLAAAQLVRAGPDAESPVLFQGGAQSLGLALASDDTREDGSSLVWIEATVDGGRGRLVRSSARLLPGATGFDAAAFGNAAVLISGPWTFRFSYAVAGAGALTWTEAWTNPRALPAAVRVEVLDPKLTPIAPPLVVKLHIDAKVECDPSENEDCGGEESEDAAIEGEANDEQNQE